MKRRRRWLTGLAAPLLLLGLAGTFAQPDSAQTAPAPAVPSFAKVTIPEIVGKPDPEDTSVTGYLFKPAGAGPFPAIVLMHGCDGLGWKLPKRPTWTLLSGYARRFVGQGYAALVLDSFQPRGIDQVCGDPAKVSIARRAWDSFSAAAYLSSLPFIDRKRLVLEGDSHGGSTVLLALAARWQGREPYAAGVAFYPGCLNVKGFAAPVLILIGTADDWTPVEKCQAMISGLTLGDGARAVTMKVFDGATHAFDYPYPDRVNGLGHHMRYDAPATAASWQAIDAFLAQHVGNKKPPP